MNFPTTARHWLGVPLRPWAGMAPMRLMLYGAVHAGLGILAVVLCLRAAGGALDESLGTAQIGQAAETLPKLAAFGVLIFVLFTLYGLLRLGVGIADLVPRHHVTGTVVMTGQRRFGDVLPEFVQTMIFNRRDGTGTYRNDNRRIRHEIVLDTSSGLKSFTVRSGTALSVRRGQHVRLRVSPLLGYVAGWEEMPAP